MNAILANFTLGQGVFGMSPLSIILILVVVVLLFGAKRLPDLFGSLGKSISAFQKGKEEGMQELEDMKSNIEDATEVKQEEKTS